MAKKLVPKFSSTEAAKEANKIIKEALKQGSASTIKSLMSRNASRQDLIDKVMGTLGTTEARTKTYVDTALSIIGRSRTLAVAKDSGLTWYRYIGGVIETSREFCVDRNGGYYNIDEIEDWPETEWDGKIEGTNSKNILYYCGGWNCRHEFIPVLESMLPEDVEAYNAAQRTASEATQERLGGEPSPAPAPAPQPAPAPAPEPKPTIYQEVVASAQEAEGALAEAEANLAREAYIDLVHGPRGPEEEEKFRRIYNNLNTGAREIFLKELSREVGPDWNPTPEMAARGYVRSEYAPMNQLARGAIGERDSFGTHRVYKETPELSRLIFETDKYVAANEVPTKLDRSLWRGVPNPVADDLKVGDMVIDDGFMSTTYDRNTARVFASTGGGKHGAKFKGDYKTLFKIQSGNTVTGVDVEAMGIEAHKEQEFIIARKRKFIVEKEEFEGTLRIIYIKPIE